MPFTQRQLLDFNTFSARFVVVFSTVDYNYGKSSEELQKSEKERKVERGKKRERARGIGREENKYAVQVDSVVVAICFGSRFRIHFATFLSASLDSYEQGRRGRRGKRKPSKKGEATVEM